MLPSHIISSARLVSARVRFHQAVLLERFRTRRRHSVEIADNINRVDRDFVSEKLSDLWPHLSSMWPARNLFRFSSTPSGCYATFVRVLPVFCREQNCRSLSSFSFNNRSAWMSSLLFEFIDGTLLQGGDSSLVTISQRRAVDLFRTPAYSDIVPLDSYRTWNFMTFDITFRGLSPKKMIRHGTWRCSSHLGSSEPFTLFIVIPIYDQ